MKNPKIIGPGSSNVDLTGFAPKLPTAGETVMGTRLAIGPGGKGSNQMTAAARAGGDVYFITRLGKDTFGKVLESHFEQEGFRKDHILVSDEAEANDILAKIRAGEISFEDAAKAHSSCPSGAEGGCLGDFGRGQMVPEFDQACFSMEVGELRGPVQTQFGYHLIKLNDKKEAQPIPYDTVKEQIRAKLIGDKQQAAYQSKINQLKIMYPVDKA